MKTLLKVVAVIVVVIVVLVAAAAFIVPRVIDPNAYKGQIAAEVKKATGRELTIVGNIGLTVFPWLGIHMGKVELGNPPDFKGPMFASTDEVDVRVKLLPLLHKRVEMDTVVVHGLRLNLVRNAKGRTNWQDLAGRGGAGKPAGGGGGAGGLAGIAIGGLDIRDANVTFDDEQAGRKFAVRNLALRTGAFEPGKPIDLSLGLGVESTKPVLKGRIEGKGRLAFDPAAQTAKVSGLSIDADLKGPTLPGGEAKITLAADAAFDGAKHDASLEGLKLTVLDMTATGRLAATALDKGGKLAGKLKVAEFSPRKLLEALGQKAPTTADPKALTRASLDADIAGTARSVIVKPLAVKLDDSSLTGEVSVSDFARPAIRFALALDGIDADRYLPPPAPGAKPAAATPGAAASQAGTLPVQTLRKLDVDGSFHAGKVKVEKLTLTDLKAKLTAKNGLIRLSPVSAKLYDGTYAGDIGLDVRPSQPHLSVNERLAGIQAGPLLKDLQGQDRLTGKGDVAVKATAVGTAPDAIKKTLNGNVRFSFTDGAIKGIDIPGMIRSAQAKISGQPAPAASASPKTDFSELTGTVDCKDGHCTNKDLNAKSPLLRVSGSGSADLPTEKIDYTVKAAVVASLQGQGGKGRDALVGLTIPIKVTGTFSKPSYGLDVQALASALVKSKATSVIQQQGGKVLQGVTGGAGAATGGSSTGGGGQEILKGAGGALKGLLGQ